MAGPESLPDWVLERYLLGELPPAKQEAVRQRLEQDADARARLQRLEASNQDILAAYPPERMVPALRRRAEREAHPSPSPWRLAVPALVTAALVAVWVYPQHLAPRPALSEADPGTVRMKGLRPHLVAWRVEGRSAEVLADGDAAHPGDTLQLHYVSAGRRFGAVVSVDGRGQVTLHLPAQPGEAVALGTEGEVALPRAYALDDAPHFERFFLVTSNEPFSVDRVLEAAHTLASRPGAGSQPLPLPEELEQSPLFLRKVSP